MIVVLEGISAAGKTTFARRFGAGLWLPELEPLGPRPKDDAPLENHATFWANHNIRRFQLALAIEAKHGFVVCDTDPMKIHYAWCMEKAGFNWPDKFAVARRFVRRAIVDRQIGFADRYFVKRIDPDQARKQKEGDETRRRGNFDQHLALQPHLMRWFETLSDVLPGRVEFAFPDQEQLLAEIQNKTPEENPRRFDVSIFDSLVGQLPD